MVLVSRIVPKMNLTAFIESMRLIKEHARLAVAGPIEDAGYCERCLELIKCLPDPERVQYVGSIPANEVVSFLSRFDPFVFPTLGENFGHAVLEALAAGTPVPAGNDTPWRQIEARGGGAG